MQHLANAVSSTEARRRKENDAIIRQNIALYNKLLGVRASEEFDRRAAEQHFRTSRAYVQKLSTKREAPRPTPPGMLQSKTWDDRWQIPAKEAS